MKLGLNKDTLAYQFGMRPYIQHRNMGALPLKPTVDFISKLLKQSDIYKAIGVYSMPLVSSVVGIPEEDALVFYLLNHATGVIRQKVHVYEPLGGKYLNVVNRYHVELAARATRMFCYLLLICTRESRHDKQNKASSDYIALTDKYGIGDFHKSIMSMSSLGAASFLQGNPPPTSLGAYTKFLVNVFHNGKYNHGFGGEAWAKVAEVLRDFVHGTLTAEMMMDTAFTLCHNNGPIFNKGMLFQDYTQDIYKILDVQRSGQIPQFIQHGGTTFCNSSVMKELSKLCEPVLGVDLGYVDWFQVEDLGALKPYSSEKKMQVSLYGFPSKFKAKKEAEATKLETIAKQKLADLVNKIEITPGQFVTKVGRTAW